MQERELWKSISSLKNIYVQSWKWARYGIFLFDGIEQCYLCGKQEDYLLNWFAIYHIFEDEQVRAICQYHPDKYPEFRDCITSDEIKAKDDELANVEYKIYRGCLSIYIWIRFIYRFSLSIFAWKIYFPIALAYRKLRYD